MTKKISYDTKLSNFAQFWCKQQGFGAKKGLATHVTNPKLYKDVYSEIKSLRQDALMIPPWEYYFLLCLQFYA